MSTIVTCPVAAGGGYDALRAIAEPRLHAFCEAHGYDLVTPDLAMIDGRGPAWVKVPHLIELLDAYDDVLLLDADTVIMRTEVPFPSDEMREDGGCMALVEQVVPWAGEGHVPNTGVWGVNRDAVALLEAIWRWPGDHNGQYANEPWMEQSAYMAVVGYEMRKPHPPLDAVSIEHHGIWHLEPDWNRLKDEPLDTAIIRHASGLGITYEMRERLMTEWVAQ